MPLTRHLARFLRPIGFFFLLEAWAGAVSRAPACGDLLLAGALGFQRPALLDW
jgi:hypothetical protein